MMEFRQEVLICNLVGVQCKILDTSEAIKLFNFIDKDSSGNIVVEEISKLFDLVYYDNDVSMYRAKQILNTFDLNNNGAIDFFEFKVLSFRFGLDSLREILNKLSKLDIDLFGYIQLKDILSCLNINSPELEPII